jgi:hypothetical protein
MSLMQGSNTCININGNPSSYSQRKRGLRQRDPLSHFLFDLITNVLCQILLGDQQLNLISRLGPSLNNGLKCIYFLYADDIIFFKRRFE